MRQKFLFELGRVRAIGLLGKNGSLSFLEFSPSRQNVAKLEAELAGVEGPARSGKKLATILCDATAQGKGLKEQADAKEAWCDSHDTSNTGV